MIFTDGKYKFNTDVEYLILDKNITPSGRYEIYKNKVLVKKTKDELFIEEFIERTWMGWFLNNGGWRI